MPSSSSPTRLTQQSAFDRLKSAWINSVLFITRPVIQRLLPDPYTEAGNVRLEAKPASTSRVTITKIVSAEHCNLNGCAYAGIILGWVDIAAGIAAKRHAISPSVTRSVDDVAFLHPVKVGDIVSVQASVNKSWKTSMEVGVKVEAESPLSNERFFVAHAYLTFVALSPRPEAKTHLGRVLSGLQPIAVPKLLPQTDMEKKRYDMAERRRQQRFQTKSKPDYSRIREQMREWSQGLKERVLEDAPIKHHPGYFTESAATSPVPMEEGTEEQAPMLSNIVHKEQQQQHPTVNTSLRRGTAGGGRRYSQDPKMCLQSNKEQPMSLTFAEVVELVMPQHANTLGITFGGQIMAWMETCAITSANRLAKAYLLTASIDSLNFIASSGVGDVVTIRSLVSKSFNSSMEVYVTVEAENLLTGEIKFTNDGFFTITALDHESVPVIIPKILPQTEADNELYEGGHERRLRRLNRRQEVVHLVKASQQSMNHPSVVFSSSVDGSSEHHL